MKTKLSPANPFADVKPTWAYGYEAIPPGSAVLDIGARDGAFIDRLAEAKRAKVAGVERDQDQVTRYQGPNELRQGDGRSIPYSDASFDVVTMFDVLEHIHDQRAVLKEIHRVLKPGGKLVISVPRRHVFTFLDMGNWKYAFPALHRWWYTRKHSAEAYNYRYVANPSGLKGIMEQEKDWHQHFYEKELVGLLAECGFHVVNVDGYGLFGDVMNVLSYAGLSALFPPRIRDWDNRTFEARQFCCLFAKSS